MPYWHAYYHLVWATRERAPIIQPAIEPRLYAYIVRKAAENGAYVYAINGWYDPIHLIAAIPPSVAVANLVMRMKGASAHDLITSRRAMGPLVGNAGTVCSRWGTRSSAQWWSTLRGRSSITRKARPCPSSSTTARTKKAPAITA